MCVLFGPSKAGGSSLNTLVKKPLQCYSSLTGKSGCLTNHLNCQYHQTSEARAQQCRSQHARGTSVAGIQDRALSAERAANRAALQRVLRCVEHLGRLGQPLRGHRDSGTLQTDEQVTYNEGVFRATLQLMVESGDAVLKRHLDTTGKRATYISPASQNQLVQAIDTVLRRDIVAEAASAEFFSLLADETTDISGKEQLSVCLRYVLPDSILRERLLTFEQAPDLTGAGLAAQLLRILRDNEIDISRMVGQGYDGAAAMSGCDNGVQKHISGECPAASYGHCASHALNLCLVKAGTVREIQAAVTTMADITTFFSASNQCLSLLQASITEKCPSSSRTRLKRHCATRWVENQEAVQVFKELFSAVTHALDALTEHRDGSVVGKATAYLDAITAPSFLISLEIMCTVLAVTKPLSLRLQAPSRDLLKAVQSVDECIDVLESYRDEAYDDLYSRVEETLGHPIPMPRLAGRQRHRSNHQVSTSRDYYRVAVFLPYIDACLVQLRERFKSHRARGQFLCSLLPSACVSRSFSDVEEAVEMYASFLDCSAEEVKAQFHCWQSHWQRQDAMNRPSRVLDALREARIVGTFPAIATLLHIFATLPVTTATSERSFSALKYLKNYLRSTMTQPRLNGLALIYVHRDMPLNYDAVIDEFGRGNRRLKFT